MKTSGIISYTFKSFLILIATYGLTLLVKPLIAPPTFVTPIWPSAGIGVAALILWGYKFIPAIILAEVLIKLQYYDFSSMVDDPTLLLTYLLLLFAATIRSVIAKFLTDKFIGNNSYTSFLPIFKLYSLAAIIPCFISSLIATLSWSLSTSWDLDSIITTLITWWVGDTIGVFIFLPLMLMLFNKPKSVWYPRFVKSIIPVIISFLLLMFLAAKIINFEKINLSKKLESESKVLLQNGFFPIIKSTGYNLDSKPNSDRNFILNDIFTNETERLIQELGLNEIQFKIIEISTNEEIKRYESPKVYNKEIFWSLSSVLPIYDGHWQIHALATPDYIKNNSTWFLWWLLSLGFLFISFLVAGLLVLTGNTMLIEQKVNKRTNEIKSLNKFLKESEEKYKQLIEIQPVVFWRYYLGDNVLNFLSNEAVNMLGYPKETLMKLEEIWSNLIHEDDRQRVYNEFNMGLASKKRFIITYRAVTKSGEILWLKDYVSTRNVHNRLELVGLKVDVTQEQEKENKIKQLAYYDTMTKLPNHLKFMEYLNTAINHSIVKHHYGAVIFLDLDRFKLLNDSLGHNFGDHLLKEIARRLNKLLDNKYIPSRFGGDEFVVLFDKKCVSLTEIKEAALKMAESIQFVIKQPFYIDSHTFYTDCSIGISIYPKDSEVAEEIVQQADTAMYASKANKSSSISFFNINMKKDANHLLKLEKSLKEAIENEEFTMYYQPIFDNTMEIKGSESLIRWNHPEKGILGPDKFIKIAEETGIIYQLGRWIIDHVFKQIVMWKKQNLKVLPVSINISLLQFKSEDLSNHLEYCIQKYGIDPTLITLELTESIAVKNFNSALKKLHTLKSLGFQIALDDFGTGYSSLNYLASLPFDILKIDKSFTCRINEDERANNLIETIVLMAKKLNLKVTAEGVETHNQFDFLNALKCEKFQGYLVSKPLPVVKFNQFLAKLKT